MDNRILIRSSLARWPAYLCYGLAGILFVVGVICVFAKAPVGLPITLIVLGIALVLGTVMYETHRQARIMWLSLEPTRFTVTDNIGERSFADDDVVSMALQVKDNFTNGNHTSTTRTFRIWVVAQGDQPELIPMVSTNKVAESPPLQPFIDRIVKLLRRRAEEDRLRNLSVLGEGWELTNRQLHLRQLPEDLEISLDEIVAAQPIDGKLKIWKQGSDEAVASLPLDAANAHLLYVLLQDHLAQRPAVKEPPAGQLGHIVFEKRTSTSIFFILLLLCIVLLMIGAALIISVNVERGKHQDPTGITILAGILLGVGTLFGFLAWMVKRALFRCHACGIYHRGLFRETTLHFHELEEFTYSATKLYNHGSYIGTYVRLAFVPRKESGKKKIVYSTSIKNADAALEHLRNEVGLKLAQKFVDEVLVGKAIQWTNQLTLEPDGLRYKKISLLSKTEPVLIAYKDISHVTLHQETLSFYQSSRPKPFITEQASKKNFYPGYFAIQALMAKARAT